MIRETQTGNRPIVFVSSLVAIVEIYSLSLFGFKKKVKGFSEKNGVLKENPWLWESKLTINYLKLFMCGFLRITQKISVH